MPSSRSLYSRKPSQSLEWLWTTGAVLATALALAGCVIADFAEGGMGSSNGRVVSFLNSLNAVASYRRQGLVLKSPGSHSPNSQLKRSELLYMRSTRHSLAHRCKLFLLVFLAKFGSASLGSILIGATPVILKGPRHMASWLFALACVQMCPKDSVYHKLQTHAVLLLVVRLGCAMYKLRKFNFVADFALARHQSFGWMLLAEIVVIDGNNLCSRISTWGFIRGCRQTSWSDLREALKALLHRIVPIILASLLYFFSLSHERRWINFFVVPVKLVVFGMFLIRYDTHTLARTVLRQGLLYLPQQRRGGELVLDNNIHFPPLPPPLNAVSSTQSEDTNDDDDAAAHHTDLRHRRRQQPPGGENKPTTDDDLLRRRQQSPLLVAQQSSLKKFD